MTRAVEALEWDFMAWAPVVHLIVSSVLPSERSGHGFGPFGGTRAGSGGIVRTPGRRVARAQTAIWSLVSRVLVLAASAAEKIRSEIRRSGGNEVCFVARVDESGEVGDPRVVARGNLRAVVAAIRDAEPGTVVVHNHPSGQLTPSDPDLAIAAELYERGVGMAITDNDARELYVVVEPPRPKRLDPLDESVIETALAPGGPLSRAHPSYEDRPMQREMARAIVTAYNQGGVMLAEAGTGTGKSIAYLLPAIRWAVQNRERTIVSTNTINLQEQLVEKDLPFLRRSLGEPFRFSLVKGRRNYVSIRRAHLAAQGAGMLFDEGQRAELDAIMEWLRGTREGSIQDLPFQPAPEVWDEVASESDVCLRAKCPHFERCFTSRLGVTRRRPTSSSSTITSFSATSRSDGRRATTRLPRSYRIMAASSWTRRTTSRTRRRRTSAPRSRGEASSGCSGGWTAADEDCSRPSRNGSSSGPMT